MNTPHPNLSRSAILSCLTALLWACGGSDAPHDAAPLKTQYALTPEAQQALDTCVADETEGSPDADRQQAAYLCEAMLGIGSKGRVTQPYERPEPKLPSTLVPISKRWERAICKLRRGDGERELVAFLGPVDYRVELANGGLLLQWEDGSAGVSADFDDEGLDKVVALREHDLPRIDDRTPLRPEWKPDVTTLAQMEAVLGKGSVVSVQWDRGMSIPLETAKRHGVPLEAVTPGCSQRVVWSHLDTGFGAGLRFRDGLLKGVL